MTEEEDDVSIRRTARGFGKGFESYGKAAAVSGWENARSNAMDFRAEGETIKT
jgi:hypothetical protein